MDTQVRHVHHPSKASLFRSTNQQDYGKVFEEDSSDPVGHLMCTGSSEVPVDDDDSGQDGDTIHEKSKEQVLGNQREDQ